MLRLVGFFALVLLLTALLGNLPFVGPLFRSTGCIGIWLTAIGLSWGLSRWGERVYRVQRDRAQVRELSAVDSPYNHGKLGSLFLGQGRPRKALPHLEAAVRGEPDVAEWRYRLGCALLSTRRFEEAASQLKECTAREEEHAYGAAQMRLAEALAASGRHGDALDALAVQERNHGPSPESAYRRGLVCKALGRRDEARAAFAEVGQLASRAARYQRKQAGLWTAKARLASFF